MFSPAWAQLNPAASSRLRNAASLPWVKLPVATIWSLHFWAERLRFLDTFIGGSPNRRRCWLTRQSTAAAISDAEAEVAGTSAWGQGTGAAVEPVRARWGRWRWIGRAPCPRVPAVATEVTSGVASKPTVPRHRQAAAPPRIAVPPMDGLSERGALAARNCGRNRVFVHRPADPPGQRAAQSCQRRQGATPGATAYWPTRSSSPGRPPAPRDRARDRFRKPCNRRKVHLDRPRPSS